MASRAEQKARAREARLAKEREAAAAAARKQRLGLLGGVVAVAVVVVVVVIAISSSGSSGHVVKPNTKAAVAAQHRVDTLLAGIPQSSDDVLGNPKAPVTITEYGDLECSVCDDFALATNVEVENTGYRGSGILNEVIDKLVRTGKARLVYDDLETATNNGATPNMFETQQAAAFSAGLQDKAWDYIELFYNEQGAEGSDYVTQSYLDGLAKQVPGLDYKEWLTDIKDPTIVSQVQADNLNGTKIDASEDSGPSTPTLVVSGPKKTTDLTPGIPSGGYGAIASAVASVQ